MCLGDDDNNFAGLFTYKSSSYWFGKMKYRGVKFLKQNDDIKGDITVTMCTRTGNLTIKAGMFKRTVQIAQKKEVHFIRKSTH